MSTQQNLTPQKNQSDKKKPKKQGQGGATFPIQKSSISTKDIPKAILGQLQYGKTHFFQQSLIVQQNFGSSKLTNQLQVKIENFIVEQATRGNEMEKIGIPTLYEVMITDEQMQPIDEQENAVGSKQISSQNDKSHESQECQKDKAEAPPNLNKDHAKPESANSQPKTVKKATYNGFTIEQLTQMRQRNLFLNTYQLACQPRIFPENYTIENEAEDDQSSISMSHQAVLRERIQKQIDLQKEKHNNSNQGKMVVRPAIPFQRPSAKISPVLFERLKEILLCSVCSEIYVDPLNVKSCLHKFCANCINDQIRLYKKQCPQCRQQILSKRHLKNDYKMQNIIQSLISNTSQFNKYENQIRKIFVKQKVTCKEYVKKNKQAIQQQNAQIKAVEKDKEDINQEMRILKNKYKKDTKMIRKGLVSFSQLMVTPEESKTFNEQEVDDNDEDYKPSAAKKQKPINGKANKKETRAEQEQVEDEEEIVEQDQEPSSPALVELSNESNTPQQGKRKYTQMQPIQGSSMITDAKVQVSQPQSSPHQQPQLKQAVKNKRQQKQDIKQVNKTTASNNQPPTNVSQQGFNHQVSVVPPIQQVPSLADIVENQSTVVQQQKTPQKVSINPKDRGIYYVEFNVQQQKGFSNFGPNNNQVLVTPERIICLSNIRIKDIRTYVYCQVKSKFNLKELVKCNIELAYKKRGGGCHQQDTLQQKLNYLNMNAWSNSEIPGQQKFTTAPNYIPFLSNKQKQAENHPGDLENSYLMTLDDLIKKGIWQRQKCDMDYKEANNIPFGPHLAKHNETLYVRFVQGF